MVDIIIPIYNAYDAVRECLESVIKNTNLECNRLILINDKSTDDRMDSYLQDFSKKYSDKNIIFLSNEKNLGFVGTVNVGMRYSANDVILLNSDTEVPTHWVENMQKCAYSQKDVATVTALSNNATLASVPIGLQRNELPEHMSFEEYAELVETTSFCHYPEIPTAHGFCVYIRRNVLDIVGGFDEETFGKGYGEENDFSYRCLDFGYKHLLCDNVLVYHKESLSFTDEKLALIERNLGLLKMKFPLHTKETEYWCSRFPIADICGNIMYQINNKSRPNVLFIIHDWSNISSNVGGTTLHCLDIIKGLRNEYNFHVFAPENGGFKLYSYFEYKETEIDLGTLTKYNTKSRYNIEYRELFENIVEALDISYVHVHHMLGHYFDIIDVCKDKGISNAITLHDFYCLCPTINMLYKSETYCLDLCEKDCVKCLREKCNIAVDITYDWKMKWKDYLSQFEHVITPSKSTKDIIQSQIGDINIQVIEHGIDIFKEQAKKIKENSTFNIAFVGVLTKHKGSDYFEYLIKHCSNSNVKFHLFGKSEVKGLSKSFSNYTFHGQYQRNELSKLLKENDIHLVCNLAIWPETYSYTLTETVACGIPVLSFELGAVAERINKYGLGWTIDETDKEVLVKKVNQIVSNTFEYNQVIDNINNYLIKTVADMNQEYKVFYEESVSSRLNKEAMEKILTRKGQYFPTNIDLETMAILSSKRWRIVKRLRVPNKVKRVIKKIIRR